MLVVSDAETDLTLDQGDRFRIIWPSFYRDRRTSTQRQRLEQFER